MFIVFFGLNPADLQKVTLFSTILRIAFLKSNQLYRAKRKREKKNLYFSKMWEGNW